MTRLAAMVLLGEVRHPANREDAIASKFVGKPLAHVLLDAIQCHGRQKLAVRELRQSLGLTTHADEPLDEIVPGRDVGVSDGPVDGDAVARIGFEIEIAPPIDLASPDDRLAADLTGAKPK